MNKYAFVSSVFAGVVFVVTSLFVLTIPSQAYTDLYTIKNLTLDTLGKTLLYEWRGIKSGWQIEGVFGQYSSKKLES